MSKKKTIQRNQCYTEKNNTRMNKMKEISDTDIETIKNLLDRIDKFQSSLSKDCIHVLKGIDPAKISIKKFDETISVAKRASDEIEKDIKHLKRLFK